MVVEIRAVSDNLTSPRLFIGYTVFKNFSPEVIVATIAVAAGAILAMLSGTMMPEAFEEGHNFIGVISVIGFLAAFVLTKLGT